MTDFGIKRGDSDKTVYFHLRNSTTGLAESGLVYNTSGISAFYTPAGGSPSQITLATQTVNGAHSEGGFVEVDGVNAKGLYRLDLPDPAIASGDFVVLSMQSSGVIEESMMVPLHDPAGVIRDELTGSPSTTSLPGLNLPSSTNDSYIGRTVVMLNGSAAGEATDVTDYVGSSKTLTVTALAATPASGDKFLIV